MNWITMNHFELNNIIYWITTDCLKFNNILNWIFMKWFWIKYWIESIWVSNRANQQGQNLYVKQHRCDPSCHSGHRGQQAWDSFYWWQWWRCPNHPPCPDKTTLYRFKWGHKTSKTLQCIARVRNCPDDTTLNSLFGICLLSFCLFI